ncbi:MAG: energy transducer TonB [Thiohalocapsa sp.]
MPDALRDFTLPADGSGVAVGAEAPDLAVDRGVGGVPGGVPAEMRDEPHLGTGPVIIGFDEGPSIEAPRLASVPADRQRSAWRWGIAASLGVHLLPLLLFLAWSGAAAPLPAPIPVTLVLEEPPPPPPKPPAPKSQPTPRGPIASIDIGDPAAKAPQPAPIAPSPETAPRPEPPAPPAPRPLPPKLVSALPSPAMTGAKWFAEPLPTAPPAETPAPLPPKAIAQPTTRPATKRVAAARLPAHAMPHPGDVLGPAATRDEYLFRCEAMIRRNYGMLSASLLAGRSGIAVLSIVILGDGRIARVAVVRSSGYPDIDARAERMVTAVRRFPPIPQWFQGYSMPVHFQLAFRNGVPL